MKKLLVLSILLASAALAQTTTVTVTITVPSAAGPVVTAWLKTQCATFVAPTSFTCATYTYPTVQSYIQALLTPPINAAIAQAVNWALATNDPSLPASLRTAVTNLVTDQTTITAGAASAVPAVTVQ